VHALQNFFHFEFEDQISDRILYNINAILADDIVIKAIIPVRAKDDGSFPHCRFDAHSRLYRYYLHQQKDPFIRDRAYYYPYTLELESMQRAAAAILEYTDFTSFSKRNTQVKTFACSIAKSNWNHENSCLVYEIRSNRFLRGMVRSLVGTMLLVGRNKISTDEFRRILDARDCTLADFSAPAHGLILAEVEFPKNIFA